MPAGAARAFSWIGSPSWPSRRIQDGFLRGSTGTCDTYKNCPLCASGEFDVLNFECWGFTTATNDAELMRETAGKAAGARSREGRGRLLRSAKPAAAIVPTQLLGR